MFFVEKAKMPLVVKADGLAAGKGVYICEKKKMQLMQLMKFLWKVW